MLFVNGKYITVFQPAIRLSVSENIVFANLSSSKKNATATEVIYENMSWKARFVGDAFEPAKALRNKDKIDIIKGAITNRYNTEKRIHYIDVIIFEFAMSDINQNDDSSSENSKHNNAESEDNYYSDFTDVDEFDYI